MEAKTLGELRKLKREYYSLKKELKKIDSNFKLSVERLKENEEKYRLIFENSGEAILLTDPNGDIYAANPEACRIFNMTEAEICEAGRNGITDLNDHKLKSVLDERRKTGKFRGEINHIRKGGIIFPAEVSSILYKDSRGTERTCIILHDITNQKLTETKLIEHRNELQTIFDCVPSMICILDTTRKVLNANNAFRKYTGWPDIPLNRSDKACGIIGCINSLDDPEGCGSGPKCVDCQIRNAIDDTIATGEQHLNVEYKTTLLVDKIKKEAVFIGSVASITGLNKIILSLLEITDQKNVETALRKSEQWLTTIINSMEDALLVVTPNRTITRINNAVIKMFGYNEREITGKSTSILHVDKKHYWDFGKKISDAFTRGETARFEFNARRKDGSIFPSEHSVSALYNDKMKVTGIVSIIRDITVKKVSEAALYDASMYARSLIEASLDPFMTINIEGKITDVNYATEKITGNNRSKLIGSDFSNCFTEPDKAIAGYKLVFAQGQIKDFPLTINNINGQNIEVNYNATLYKNASGEIEGVFAIARDMTEIRRMEYRLRESKVQLELLNQHLIDLRENERANISREIHDQLGQSLTILKLEINQLAESAKGNKKVIDQIRKILALVNSTISKTQQLSADLRPGILDDLGLVSTIEWYCKDFQKRTNIKCVVDTDSSSYIDQDINLAIFRVLQEALTNVLRHSHATEVNVILQRVINGISFCVWDNGVGIKNDKIYSKNSLGLAGMSERVRQVGGIFTVTRLNGTKLSIYVPEINNAQ